ncbi:MAG: hypothetical protein NT157_04390 [Candidatus Micrarchaeota archaeon]|nr:hypothetical protein [Candidatus Micrarchaeota archaeon]
MPGNQATARKPNAFMRGVVYPLGAALGSNPARARYAGILAESISESTPPKELAAKAWKSAKLFIRIANRASKHGEFEDAFEARGKAIAALEKIPVDKRTWEEHLEIGLLLFGQTVKLCCDGGGIDEGRPMKMEERKEILIKARHVASMAALNLSMALVGETEKIPRAKHELAERTRGYAMKYLADLQDILGPFRWEQFRTLLVANRVYVG